MLWTILFPGGVPVVECFLVLHGNHLQAPLPGVSQLLLVSSGLVVTLSWPLTTVDNVLMLSSGVGVYRLPEHNLEQSL